MCLDSRCADHASLLLSSPRSVPKSPFLSTIETPRCDELVTCGPRASDNADRDMTDVTAQPSVFAMDEATSQRSTHSSADQSTDAPNATATDSRSSSQQQQEPDGQKSASPQIDLARKVVPVQDFDDDVCSICLDEFSHDDPAQLTECRCVAQCASIVPMHCDQLTWTPVPMHSDRLL